MGKVIFIDHDKLNRDLKEIKVFKEKADRTYQVLNEFGIDNPEAVRSPLEAVNAKLKGILTHDESFDVAPEKAADLIGKGAIYEELQGLNKIIIKSTFMEKLRWNKKQFSIKAGYEKELKEEASVIITSEKQIELHNRTEAFIKESEDLTQAYGEKYHLANMVHFLNPFQIKSQKIIINHHIFLRQTKHLENGIELKKPEAKPKPRRIMGMEKSLIEMEVERKQKLIELKIQLEQKIKDGASKFGLSEIKLSISKVESELRGIEQRLSEERKHNEKYYKKHNI